MWCQQSTIQASWSQKPENSSDAKQHRAQKKATINRSSQETKSDKAEDNKVHNAVAVRIS